MKLWFTRAEAPLERGWTKRFAASDWTVDFPRGAMASVVVGSDKASLTVTASFLRRGDLVGLIYESEDRFSHPARRRDTSRDYSRCTLRFRWQSNGLVALDAVNGPVLTIEGRDEAGNARTWYVRLWNYATGTSGDAVIELDFDALDAGYLLPAEAQRVWPKDIDRLFFGLVSPDYAAGSDEFLDPVGQAVLTISDVRCDKSGSMIGTNAAWSPEHGFGACTSYDDQYNLSPERVVAEVEASGFRGDIIHYVGMSHYATLGSDGLVDPASGMCAAALQWHRAYAHAAAERGMRVIWSLSYELLDQFCPSAWKQRAFDGQSAATGYDPPSTLLSPANAAAMDYLKRIAVELVGLSLEAGLQPRFQIGEPWWWLRSDGAICCYDAAAQATLGGSPVAIANVRGSLNAEQKTLLDLAGALLAQSTAALAAAVKAAAPGAEIHLLTYLPGVLDPTAPEVRRANLPVGWAKPAFDRLQLEDYEWVTGRRTHLRQAGYATVAARLGYPASEQHYLSGFVPSHSRRNDWNAIIKAAEESIERGCERSFLWAMPQWVRDGCSVMRGESEMKAFEDVGFPIAIGKEASVAPGFSTNVVTSASGHEYRNANWQQARLRFDAGPGVRSEEELGELIAFFRARRGSAVAFRFRDPFDFSSNAMQLEPTAMDEAIGVGDGVTTEFQLVKRYGDGELRRITRPEPGSVKIAIDGDEIVSGWTVEEMGVVRFVAPPALGQQVSGGFLFDVPVRFESDQLEINRASFRAGEAPSVPLVEVRE